MLATLTDRRDFGGDWLLERKLDGERCVARKDGGDVRLESRTAKNLSTTYPEVSAGVAAQRSDGLLLDGELVAFDGEQTSFSRLQQRLGVVKPSPQLVAEYPVVYCVFDLLELDGEDLTGRPLTPAASTLAVPWLAIERAAPLAAAQARCKPARAAQISQDCGSKVPQPLPATARPP